MHSSALTLYLLVDDPLPTPTPESVFLEDVQLPEEVAKFFHSKSFHPEDLENLRGILKRSQDHCTSQQQTPSLLEDRWLPQSGTFSHIPHRSASPTATSPDGLQSPPPSEPRRYTEAHSSLYSMFEDMRRCFASYPLMNTPSTSNTLVGGQLDRGRKTGIANTYRIILYELKNFILTQATQCPLNVSVSNKISCTRSNKLTLSERTLGICLC